MFRDLLVHVDGSEAGRCRTRFSSELAARMGAKLTGFHVTPPAEVPPRFKPTLVPEVEAHIRSRLAFDAERARAIFGDETKGRSAQAKWFETIGDVAEGICDKARFADLVILGQYEWQGFPEFHPLPIAHHVVTKCGRPVLVVPAAAVPRLLEKIVIAWDGSREAVRAVHDALPLLRVARSVQIVQIIPISASSDDASADSLLDHLANHEIKGTAQIQTIDSVADYAALQKQIEQGGYDLVVMGGYSHPMWLEFIFGGATRSILLSSTTPIFVSH
jgi:nucleotide-binding universal stress UspA family protein